MLSPKEVTQRAKRIRLMCLDVDGVLTDGGLYYDKDGCVMKRFDVQDGLGVKMGQEQGLVFAVISGLNMPAVEARVTELGIGHYHPGHHRKVPSLQGVLESEGLGWDQCCYVGDDWVDAAPMRRAGLALATANAQPEIVEIAHHLLSRRGGEGAVREAVNLVLSAQGRLQAAFRRWSAE